MELLGSILERPIVQAEYTSCLPHLVQLLKQEIDMAKVGESIPGFLCDQNFKSCPLSPEVMSAIFWHVMKYALVLKLGPIFK